MTLTNLSDDELLASLSALCFETQRLLARLLVHLIEVEERRLDLRSACSSLYDFCVRRLGMSESEAVRRIEAARLAKRFPVLLEHVEREHLHLTALLMLRGHLTEENVDELVAQAKGKTKREIQELLAMREPKLDVPPSLRASPSTSRLEPLAPSRHRLELTIGSEVRAKLERARDLLGHRVPNGDLEAVLDRALDALIGKLEKERSPVEREVLARDGERCTFTDERGNRCPATTRLELDHIVPRALGGRDEPPNLRVRCRAHNKLWAEQVFGREHVEARIDLRQRRCEAERALVNLGFRKTDVRRTLAELLSPGATLPPLADLLRMALGALTHGQPASHAG